MGFVALEAGHASIVFNTHDELTSCCVSKGYQMFGDAGVVSFIGVARCMIDGGGVNINRDAITKTLAEKEYNVAPERLTGAIIQVGKRKFIRLV